MQVESMKTELKRASDDSKRLTDKLCRLEEDNRQLEAMVSRLGGQDARKLKAQVPAVLRNRSQMLARHNLHTHLVFSPLFLRADCLNEGNKQCSIYMA